MADNLIIKIDGDVSHLERELDNAAGAGVRAFKQFTDSTNRQLSRIEDEADDIRNKLVTAGKDGGNAMTDGANQAAGAWSKVKTLLKTISGAMIVREIAKIGKESIGLASDLTEVQNVIDVTFGEGNQKVEDFSKSAAKQFGISELSAKRMAGTMGAMLKSLDVKEVDDMSLSLVGLAADMGSFYNLDAEEAFAKLRSGISGETEPLKQLGINMSVANLEAYALSQGISKQFKDMTAAEQATLRYNYIMKATADAQGDFARTSGSMANQLKIAKLNIETVKASLGKALLPAATAAVHGMNNFITNIQRGFPAIQKTVSNFVQSAGEKLNELGIGEKLTQGLDFARAAINEAIDFILNIFQSAASSPVLQAIGNALMNVFTSLIGLVSQMGALVSTLWEYIEPIWESLKESVGSFVDAFLEAKLMMVDIWQKITGVLSSAIELVIGILTLNKEKIISGAKGLYTNVLGIFQTLWTGIGKILESLWEGIVNFFSTLWEKIKAKFKEMNLKENGKELLESLQEGFRTAWEAIKTWLSERKQMIEEELKKIDLRAVGESVISKLGEGFSAAWTAVTTWLSDKKQAIIDYFDIDLKAIGEEIVNSLKAGLEEKWVEVTDWFKGAVEDLTGWLPEVLKAKLGLNGKATLTTPASGSEEDLSSAGAPRGKQKVLGVYKTGTVTPEEALKAYEAMEDAAQTVEKAAKTAEKAQSPVRDDKRLAAKESRLDPQLKAVESIQTAAEETTTQAASSAAAAESSATAAEATQAAAEATQAAVQTFADDGIMFEWDESQMDGLMDGLGATMEDQAKDDVTADHLQKLGNWVESLFKDTEETNEKALNGINNDMNDGFSQVTGSGGTGESEYTLLDEYNELMDIWSNNKDGNGEWTADWSKGGIGETLRDLIGGKMPGKYWGDLTEDDKKRMAGMKASDGYEKGQYETQFGGAGAAGEAVTIPANLEIVSFETEEGASDILDLDSLKEGIPEEALTSWNNLNTALQNIMLTFSGEGEEGGLRSAFEAINGLLNDGIPAGIGLVQTGLKDTLPTAVSAAIEALGETTVGENGEIMVSTDGMTLFGSLGAIKGVFEDIDTALRHVCNGLSETLPSAIRKFIPWAGKAEGATQGLAAAARAAASAYFEAAAGVRDYIDALQELADFKSGEGNGSGSGGGIVTGSGGVVAAAHGGLVSGIGIVGENGPEILSTSRNMNVFTNRALEIAQNKVAAMMVRDASSGRIGGQTNISNDNSRATTVNVGTVLGADWLRNEIDHRIEKAIGKELFYAR